MNKLLSYTLAVTRAKNRRSILVAIFPICLARFNQFTWNIVGSPSRFGHATLNESVPSLDCRRRLRYLSLVCKQTTICNRIRRSSAQLDDHLMWIRYTYNALGNAMSQLQSAATMGDMVSAREWGTLPRCHVSAALKGMVARIRTLCCMLTLR